MDGSKDAWTGFLDWLTQVVVPDWGSLVALLPLAIVGLVLLFLAMTAYRWYAAATINRSRVRRPLPAGAPPPGVHLPGPSLWPLVLPLGALLILFALAIKPSAPGGGRELVNLPLLVVGLLVAVAGTAGWFRDAGREWRRTDHGVDLDHAGGGGLAQLTTSATGLTGSTALIRTASPVVSEPPPGVHLPGPSPWPFFAPIAAMVIFFGLVFSPALVLGGIVMGVIAAAGWYRDAGREYRQVDAGHAPEPVTRDPARAFPRALVGVYLAVAAVCLVFVALPGVIAFANTKPNASVAPSGAPGPAPNGEVAIAAVNIAFTKHELQVPAGKPFKIAFDNQDTVKHNVAIFPQGDLSKHLFMGQLVDGGTKTTYDVPALQAGAYDFICSVHPNMKGTLAAR